MTLAEALMVMSYLRPLIIAGDERQLPPTVILTTQKQGDNFLDAFPLFGRVSVLEYFKRTGMGCFVLNEQLRMADERELGACGWVTWMKLKNRSQWSVATNNR